MCVAFAAGLTGREHAKGEETSEVEYIGEIMEEKPKEREVSDSISMSRIPLSLCLSNSSSVVTS